MKNLFRYLLYLGTKLRASIVVFVICLSFLPLSGHANDDADFLAAREAYRTGKTQLLPGYAERLKGSILLPYIQYWELSSRLKDASPYEIRDFMARNTDSVLSDKLRGDWLQLLGKNQDWSTFLTEYPLLVKSDLSLQCYAIRGRLAQGETLAQKDGVALWFTGKDLPDACTPLFENLVSAQLISTDDIWQRFRLALGSGNQSVAKAVLGYLSKQQPNARLVDVVTANPERMLTKSDFDLDSRFGRELTIYAIERLARKDARNALPLWEAIRADFLVSDQHYVWGQLGLYAARQHLPEALGWFDRAGVDGMNDELLAWKVREALRLGNWDVVQATILQMSDSERAESAWRYWLARAYKIHNKQYQANTLLVPLSREHDFYGLLAEEELGASLGTRTVNFKVGEDDVSAMGRVTDIARALALYKLELSTDANREWNWATRNFDDRRLLAAAELARQNDWYDRAINTANRTKQLHDFDLRFLAPYRSVAHKYAKEYGLDEAWVYGLMRQESRFVSLAKSGVGAAGLMQIMPATARWIANKLGIRHFKADSIHELDTNMQFGMYYLKTIQQNLDGSIVLATAGYNAGPGRARRWRGDQTLEGAIYAESIPFSETRDYVKKVMANAIYYARSFGKPGQALRERLGTVAGVAPPPLCGGTDENAPSCDN
ncbi:MAG: transglycosylase SLT domain-containing protein [Sulfuriferula sp.]